MPRSYSEDDVQVLKNTITELASKVKEQDELLEKILKPPLFTSTIIDVKENEISVNGAGGGLEILERPNEKVEVGDIAVRALSGQVARIESADINHGSLCTVTEVPKDSPGCVIELGGESKMVLKGRAGKNVETGHRVIVDSSASIVVMDLGRPKSTIKTEQIEDVTWDQIGGLDQAKQLLMESIEYPFEYPDTYKRFGKKPASGLLLYGPPGCGKTLLAKAAASSLRKRVGGDSGSNFIYVRGPEILEKWVGAAEANIRYLFTMARQHYKEHGYPAVLFIDEADAILGKRGTGISSDMERTTVPQFLSEMSGLENSGAITLLATNRPDVLDPAITRDGRVDHKIYIGRPDRASAKTIIQINLKSTPCAIRKDHLAIKAVDHIFNGFDLYKIVASNGQSEQFKLQHIISGAMLASIVDKAISKAMFREIASKGKEQEVTEGDMSEAVRETFLQNRDLNHSDAIQDFAENKGMRVHHVDKCPICA